MDGRSCPRFSVLWCVPAAPANGIEGGASRAARAHQTAPVGATQVPRSRTCTDVFTEAGFMDVRSSEKIDFEEAVGTRDPSCVRAP